MGTNEPKKETKENGGIDESLDTIREVLVGDFAKTLNQKITLLEQHVAREIRGTQEQGYRGLDSLEQFCKQEISILRTSLSNEQTDRIKSAEKTSAQYFELREQLYKHVKDLSSLVLEKYQALHGELELALSTLDFGKADRRLIADLLRGMAKTLEMETPPKQHEEGVIQLHSDGKKKSG